MQSQNRFADWFQRSNAVFSERLRNFFFLPSAPYTLAVMRIFTGLMIGYIHIVWMMNLESFMGPFALVNNQTWHALHGGAVPDSKWTYLAYVESMPLIWVHEILACLAGVMMAIGCFTRASTLMAWFLTLMTVHRMTGMLFGLDQIAMMVTMYLCLGRSGDVLSIDRWSAGRLPDTILNRNWFRILTGLTSIHRDEPSASCWSNTLCTRLIQLHLCMIYLFGGLGKMRGEMWWDGSAMWFSIASYEYQSLDMTWTGRIPFLSSLATHLTLLWEVSYCALIWPKWTRPWVLAVAFLVHGGIALFLGMFTFGWMMIVANFAFIPSSFFRIVRLN
jgi:hypothetical protein